MALQLVNVVKAFTLTLLQDGVLVKKRFEAGVQRIEQDVADHWFTRAHTAEVPKDVAQTDAAAEAKAAADAASSAKK